MLPRPEKVLLCLKDGWPLTFELQYDDQKASLRVVAADIVSLTEQWFRHCYETNHRRTFELMHPNFPSSISAQASASATRIQLELASEGVSARPSAASPTIASSCSEALSQDPDRYSWYGDTDWQTMSGISEATSKRKRTSPAVWKASDEAQSETAEDLERRGKKIRALEKDPADYGDALVAGQESQGEQPSILPEDEDGDTIALQVVEQSTSQFGPDNFRW